MLRIVAVTSGHTDAPVLLVEGPALASFAEAENSPPVSLATVARVLRAHALAAASSFSELLSSATLVGVDALPYQAETVRRVLKVFHGRGLLADEVGLGKTIEAIMVLREYQLRGMVRRALILVPPTLLGQWVEELGAKAGLVVRHTADRQLRLLGDDFWQGEGVVVASVALARSARHMAAVQATPWDLVIVDEAHRVKSRGSAGFRLVNGIKSRFLLLLTATPIENELEELYQIVTLLRPGQFATPAAFRATFVDPANPTSPKNRERLRSLLSEVMVRNTRAQCGLKLPPRFVSTVLVDPSPEELALYERALALFRESANVPSARLAATTLLLEAGSSPQAVAATIERMEVKRRDRDEDDAAIDPRLLALGRDAVRILSTRKTEVLLDILRAQSGKTLVFSRYRATLDHIAQEIALVGLDATVLHGGLALGEKQAALDRFKAEGVILLATDVGAEGLNLQFCRSLVNFDLPWNPMVIEQRIGRLHRYGQEGAVTVCNLCARGTIEERVLAVLHDRLQLFELVVGEMDMVLGNLTDERDLEERVLSIYAGASTEEDIGRGFAELEAQLLAARGHHEHVKALDEALFGKDFAQ